MVSLYAVVADPRRRTILDSLREHPHAAGELVPLLGISQPAVSKHLRVLREAGLVCVTRDGQRRVYELASEPLGEIDAWLRPYRELWARRLDELERHLDLVSESTREE